MIDLETLGVKPWSAVRSIGAVSFDPFGPKPKIIDQFYVNLNEQSQLDEGCTTDQSVLEWWDRQPKEVLEAVLVDKQDWRYGLGEFAEWFKHTGAKYVWSQGAAFDFPIMDTQFAFSGIGRVPWSFRTVRDTRTAYHVLGFDPDGFPREEGVHHNALDDAKHQVRALHAAMNGTN
jgi:3'-5' exoribonuclease-like protein